MAPVDCPGGRAVLDRDVGLPEEPGRLGQTGRDPDGGRTRGGRFARGRPTWWWSTPAPSSRRPARSRSTPCWPCPTPAGAGARLVVTGCMAERYGDELAEALPEVDLVAPFGASLTGRAPTAVRRRRGDSGARLGTKPAAAPSSAGCPSFDLLNLPRPPAAAPWSYIKIAEGCDRNCGFCAIPSFRGKQRSRSIESILAEVDQLGGPGGTLREVVLVAQDLSSFALDRSTGRTEPRIDGPAVGGHRPDRRPGGRGGRAGPLDPASLSLPVDARRRVGRGHSGHRRALLRPLPPARVAAVAQAHAPVGRGRAVPRADRVDPGGRADRRLPVVVHHRLSGRDRGRSRPPAPVA